MIRLVCVAWPEAILLLAQLIITLTHDTKPLAVLELISPFPDRKGSVAGCLFCQRVYLGSWESSEVGTQFQMPGF